jgi:hypothetical protein
MPSQPSEPSFAPGTRVRVVHHVRVGSQHWTTEVRGTVLSVGVRPVGGMEMGAKGLYSRQNTLQLRQDDGEITVVAIDENTEIHPLLQAEAARGGGS